MEGAKPQRRYDEPKPHETLLYAYMGQCTPCGKTINGTLYACRLCPGTEWCEACSRTTDHPIDHPFLRIQLQSDLIAEGQLDLDIEGDDAKQLWQQCVDRSPLKDAGEAVPFLTFIDQLSKFLQEDLTQGEVVALEAIFGDLSRDEAISFNSLEIQRIEYALFIKRFGPIRLSLKKVQQVLIDGQVWFHGNMDLRKSQSLFLGKPDTSFMIRYSSRTPGAFSINYMRGGQMKIFNRIANNVEGEGIHVYQSDKEKLQYSSFASFIRSNCKLFAIPVDDPLASFLKIKKQQIKDMGVNSNIPFTFNHVSTTASSVTPDDFYDALARKVNGFSSQMSISPPNTAPTSREKAPIRKSRSSNSSPNKRGIAMSSGSNMKRKPKREEQESSESRALRALLLEQDKNKKERQYRPGSHYSNFFSDDEEEDLPNIVADM